MKQWNRTPADSVPVMRLAHPLAFSGFLKEIGAPVESAFRRAQLPLLCDRADAYVPVQRVWLFYDDMARREFEALGWELGDRLQDSNLHGNVLKRLAAAPNLYQALTQLCTLIKSENTHLRMGLSERHEDILLWVHHRQAGTMAGYHVAQAYWLKLVLILIRRFAGPNWHPKEIGVESRHLPAAVKDHLEGTRIITGQQSGYIRIPRSLLTQPPDAAWAAHQLHSARQTHESLLLTDDLDFTATVRLLLETYMEERSPTADIAASLIGTSSRTLRRRLKNEGITFAELVDQVRFNVAKRMLNRPNVKMIEITYALGYGDPSHFSRAFRRLTGISPSKYRGIVCQGL